MAQVTLSCRFAAIHLETPLLGFFRNYLPSRIRTLFVFFDTLKASQKAPHSGAFSFCSEGASLFGMDSIEMQDCNHIFLFFSAE